MTTFDEAGISRAILRAYHQKLDDHLISDVVIVGAGPSGMVAAHDLAKRGYKVAIIEMRLATGGGIWGGAMSMNEVVIQEEAKQILDEFEIGTTEVSEGLYTADSVEMSTGLCYRALRAGAKVFNMTTVEDICIHDSIVTGVVINRTSATANLPIDPLMLTARRDRRRDRPRHRADRSAAATRTAQGHRRLRTTRRRTDERRRGREVRRREGRRGLPGPVDLRHVRLRDVRRAAHGTHLRRHAPVRSSTRRHARRAPRTARQRLSTIEHSTRGAFGRTRRFRARS
jgi:ribulose 1,5-bisphosphate synthetase/thiazole synthase